MGQAVRHFSSTQSHSLAPLRVIVVVVVVVVVVVFEQFLGPVVILTDLHTACHPPTRTAPNVC